MLEKTYSGALYKTRRAFVALAFIFVVFAVDLCAAQPQDPAEFQRASTTHRLAEFPKIAKDGRIWFQFKAPNAQ